MAGSDPARGGQKANDPPLEAELLSSHPVAAQTPPPAREPARKRAWAALGRWASVAPPSEPLPAEFGVLEKPEEGRYGICCSGGGIRSAAFNLGALQALQVDDEQVLQRAAYLSAVSGGSYIAAGLATVNKSGGPEDSEEELIQAVPPFAPGSPEEHYLRNHSSYMAPGAWGKMVLLGHVLRGVFANLLLVGSALFLLGMLAGAVYGAAHPGLLEIGGQADTAAAARIPLAALAAGLLAVLLAVLISRRRRLLLRIVQGWAGRLLIAAAIAAVVLVAVPELLEWLRHVPEEDTGDVRGARTGEAVAAGLGGVATVVLTALLQLRSRLTDSRLLRGVADPDAKGPAAFLRSRVWPRIRTSLGVIAAAAAGPVLCAAFFVASMLYALIYREPGDWVAPVAGAALVVGLFFFLGDVTNWSLHPFYKARLKSAFSLRRVTRRREDGTEVAVAEPRPPAAELPLSQTSVDPDAGDDPRREWPLLVVCAAANVSDPGVTPPGRAVTTFTFSPQSIGGPLIGWTRTLDYECAVDDRRDDVTLPAAVAVSGAALAPSMGKMTRWPLRFLLTLANVRLGVWLPNPRRVGEYVASRERWRGASPRWRPGATLLLKELIGRNKLSSRFLYVTDGGHYENLGLVELLRRGCRDVFCFDASGGRDTQELGDAVSLARSELQVEIDIDPDDLVPDAKSGIAAAACKRGTIRYPCGTEGKLMYVRSVLTEDAPHDVKAYHEVDPAFPHNSTGQQLYTDQRFEAYRALGACAAREALREFRGVSATASAPQPS